jgi:hypothetical protein
MNKVIKKEKKKSSAPKNPRSICSNAECRLRVKGCTGFEGCPGYKGKDREG